MEFSIQARVGLGFAPEFGLGFGFGLWFRVRFGFPVDLGMPLIFTKFQ